MDNLFPNTNGAGGMLEPLLRHITKQHPKETELVVSGGLAAICAIAFFKTLKAYLVHTNPAA